VVVAQEPLAVMQLAVWVALVAQDCLTLTQVRLLLTRVVAAALELQLAVLVALVVVVLVAQVAVVERLLLRTQEVVVGRHLMLLPATAAAASLSFALLVP